MPFGMPLRLAALLLLATTACEEPAAKSLFPDPARPVAPIVSSRYLNEDARDRIGEAETVMRLADICLPSYDDVLAITGIADPDALVDHCLRLGAKTVALKLGEKGAIVADANQRHRIAPFPCTPVDATGAGDTFGGAFVARVVAGDSLRDAGRYAAAAAALSTQGYGAVAPIPRTADVRAALEKSS